MPMKWPFRRKKEHLWNVIEEYGKKLGSANPVNAKEAITCHTAKLVLTKDMEKRLRSIQTLVELGSPSAFPPAVKDLLSVCDRWPQQGAEDLALLLRDAIVNFHSNSLH